MASAKDECIISYSNGTHERDEKVEPLQATAQSSRLRVLSALITLCGISAARQMATGLLTIGIPQIANDLPLPTSLLLWPGAAYTLASGTCFILAGSLADMVGSRTIGLVGCLIMTISLAITGISRTGIQLIVFRALQGVGAAMFLPTTISLWTSTVPEGRMRNFGFACFALASPMGLQSGTLIAGVVNPSSLTWRFGFYLSAGIMGLFFLLGCWLLPSNRHQPMRLTPRTLLVEIDWLGVFFSSLGLALLSYTLAELSNSTSNIREPHVATLLSISVALFVAFFVWMGVQERQGRKPLVPNSLWSNARFTIICLMVTLCWAMSDSMDWFFSLFFQKVKCVSPLQAAIWYIPNGAIGIVTNFLVGPLVHRLPINLFTTASCLISAAGPLIMALINPAWSYWRASFWSLLLLPSAQDVLFTVSNVIITETLPESQHGLAGGVFNSISMLGSSIGVTATAILSNSVIQERSKAESPPPGVLMAGYRAIFWADFGVAAGMTIVGAVGLRHVWYIGRAEGDNRGT